MRRRHRGIRTAGGVGPAVPAPRCLLQAPQGPVQAPHHDWARHWRGSLQGLPAAAPGRHAGAGGGWGCVGTWGQVTVCSLATVCAAMAMGAT
jgi:hypothetical protein